MSGCGYGLLRRVAEVPNAAVGRSSKPDGVGGGRGRTWSVPLVAWTGADPTSNALLEASSEAFELCSACSGSSSKPIEASTRPFEVLGRAREASSTPNEASSGPLQASTRMLEASSRAFEASSEAFEASTKALGMGLKWCNPSTDNNLRVLVLRMIPGSLMTQLLHVTDDSCKRASTVYTGKPLVKFRKLGKRLWGKGLAEMPSRTYAIVTRGGETLGGVGHAARWGWLGGANSREEGSTYENGGGGNSTRSRGEFAFSG